jgi:hypothetical protein
VSLSNNTLTGAVQSGQVVGIVTVLAAGGTFTGTITVNPTTNFVVNNVSGVYQLVTTGVVGSGSYPITLTATMVGAANNPQQLSTTISVSAESANGTSLNSATGQIIGSSTPGIAGTQDTWQMVVATGSAAPFQINLNGQLQTASSGVTQCYYIGHNFYQYNGNQWFVFNGTMTGTQAGFNPMGAVTPIPVISLGELSVTPGVVTTIPITMTVAGTTVTPTSYSLTPTTSQSQYFSISGSNLITTALVSGTNYTIDITANY